MKDLLWLEEEESLRNEPEDRDADLMASEKTTALSVQRAALEDRARREMEWFFDTLGGRVPEENTELAYARPAAEAIDGWLRAMPAFHRGALALRFTPRKWPRTLTHHYGESTSLVVRLECALHPSRGDQSTEALEQAAVLRLEEVLVKRGRDRHDLLGRAFAHESLAIRAYLRVRGERRVRISKKAAARVDTTAISAPIVDHSPAPVSAEGGHR